ncbi:hypothetical protein MHYP_G00252740 [Metynnis hypsauchen]
MDVIGADLLLPVENMHKVRGAASNSAIDSSLIHHTTVVPLPWGATLAGGDVDTWQMLSSYPFDEVQNMTNRRRQPFANHWRSNSSTAVDFETYSVEVQRPSVCFGAPCALGFAELVHFVGDLLHCIVSVHP